MTLPIQSANTRLGILRVGQQSIDVLVNAVVVYDLDDQRRCIEGELWPSGDAQPISIDAGDRDLALTIAGSPTLRMHILIARQITGYRPGSTYRYAAFVSTGKVEELGANEG
jgi:hypothetical protein